MDNERLKGPWVVIDLELKKDVSRHDTKNQAMKAVEGLNNIEKSKGKQPKYAVIPRG
jgi:hypothetical protein